MSTVYIYSFNALLLQSYFRGRLHKYCFLWKSTGWNRTFPKCSSWWITLKAPPCWICVNAKPNLSSKPLPPPPLSFKLWAFKLGACGAAQPGPGERVAQTSLGRRQFAAQETELTVYGVVSSLHCLLVHGSITVLFERGVGEDVWTGAKIKPQEQWEFFLQFSSTTSW